VASGVGAKLQVKPGMSVSFVDAPAGVVVDLPDGAAFAADPTGSDAVVAFVVDREQLGARAGLLLEVASRGGLAWIAYPKAGQLGTDLTRDSVRDLVVERGLDTVRQIAIDGVWSALRVKAVT
jgi:hypothetical protein